MSTKTIIVLILGIAILAAYNIIQISWVKVSQVQIESKKIDNNIRISQITDFHSNSRINLDNLVEKVEEFDPHIIALTGDIIDFKTTDLSLAFELVDKLVLLDKPIYFVKGNHELRNHLDNAFTSMLKSKGIQIMDDLRERMEIEGEIIDIAGTSFFAEEEDYKRLFDGLDEKSFNLLLSHSPNRPVKYLHNGVDLILSGHTHGGQVRLPIIGGLVSPGEGLFPKYDKGLMKLDDHTWLYIDSGLGNSILPIRFLNPVQISEITIKAIK